MTSRLSSSAAAAVWQGDQATKRRRGRQPRPCTLSGPARMAAATFAASVGSPRVVEPAGFRDFVGWLQRLQSPSAADAWNRLLSSLLSEAGGDVATVQRIQSEVVREIIANVITIRAGESSKLISTNARRQSARPEHGTTLMKIFDRALARAARANSGVPSIHRFNASSSSSAGGRASSSSTAALQRARASRPVASSSHHRRTQQTMRLPSMQELEESLRRR